MIASASLRFWSSLAISSSYLGISFVLTFSRAFNFLSSFFCSAFFSLSVCCLVSSSLSSSISASSFAWRALKYFSHSSYVLPLVLLVKTAPVNKVYCFSTRSICSFNPFSSFSKLSIFAFSSSIASFRMTLCFTRSLLFVNCLKIKRAARNFAYSFSRSSGIAPNNCIAVLSVL